MTVADHFAPERQLWCAVLGRAVQDAAERVGAISQPVARRRLCDEARRWFATNSADFRYACESAGYDPDYLRARVLAILPQSPDLPS